MATGSTPDEVEYDIRDALRFHVDGLREDGLPMPRPTRTCGYVPT